jgi:deoxyribonuclease (pyrimidine dimer)
VTRINLVPPEELADQHLFAEFREIKMVPKSLARSIRAWRERVVTAMRTGAIKGDPAHAQAIAIAMMLECLPERYTLNSGHVSFFYDKGLYLACRYRALRHELRRRGINFNLESQLDPDRIFWLDKRLCQNYTPTPEALALVRERISQRLSERPGWYRWTPSVRVAA